MKVYACPETIKKPNLFVNGQFDRGSYALQEDAFYAELKTHLQGLGYTGSNTGEKVRFPIADGYAVYVVAENTNGRFMLIHSPLGDAYSIPAPYARGLNKKDILENIRHQKALSELFKQKVA
jgi:hypothetical protein